MNWLWEQSQTLGSVEKAGGRLLSSLFDFDPLLFREPVGPSRRCFASMEGVKDTAIRTLSRIPRVLTNRWRTWDSEQDSSRARAEEIILQFVLP